MGENRPLCPHGWYYGECTKCPPAPPRGPVCHHGKQGFCIKCEIELQNAEDEVGGELDEQDDGR